MTRGIARVSAALVLVAAFSVTLAATGGATVAGRNAVVATAAGHSSLRARGVVTKVASSDIAWRRQPRIVGRWARTRTCRELVDALARYGLAATAPAAVGDYFPGQTPEELSKKSDVCAGASPSPHSHFFSRGRMFGSVDESGHQVDDGTYRLVNRRTIRINDGKFRYRIHSGRLALTPLITDAQRAAALAAPLKFSAAIWMVAVAYPGHAWKRVPCHGWC